MTVQRVGLGTDLHRLEPGDTLVLGGVHLPSTVRAVGHSDADVVLHALSDAILGAVGAGDIGTLFPDTDPAHAELDSLEILAEALSVARARGCVPVNVDVVVALERPRVSPHRDAIRARLAELLGIPADRVGLKAKTEEGLGPIGEGRAIGATAVVLLAEEETG